MVQALVFDERGCPVGKAGIGPVVDVGGIHILPMCAIYRFGNADAGAMYPGNTMSIGIGSAPVGVQHKPLVFFAVIDEGRVGSAIIYRIVEEGFIGDIGLGVQGGGYEYRESKDKKTEFECRAHIGMR